MIYVGTVKKIEAAHKLLPEDENKTKHVVVTVAYRLPVDSEWMERQAEFHVPLTDAPDIGTPFAFSFTQVNAEEVTR